MYLPNVCWVYTSIKILLTFSAWNVTHFDVPTFMLKIKFEYHIENSNIIKRCNKINLYVHMCVFIFKLYIYMFYNLKIVKKFMYCHDEYNIK